MTNLCQTCTHKWVCKFLTEYKEYCYFFRNMDPTPPIKVENTFQFSDGAEHKVLAYCPSCDAPFLDKITRLLFDQDKKFCAKCGQALDWSE